MHLGRYTPTDLASIRTVLIEVYAEVYAAQTHEPFHSVERFAQRLDGHVTAPRWEAVLAWEADQCAGYVYGYQERRRPDEFGLCELMVRTPWRGTGLSRALHDELLAGRSEVYSSLYVEQAKPRVRALYESWGYQKIGEPKPFPDAPPYDELVLKLL